jgi:hypothetical protein
MAQKLQWRLVTPLELQTSAGNYRKGVVADVEIRASWGYISRSVKRRFYTVNAHTGSGATG